MKSGDATVYRSNPDALASARPGTRCASTTSKFDVNFTPWGCICGTPHASMPGAPPRPALNVWGQPGALRIHAWLPVRSPNEVVFDLPVLNPGGRRLRSAVEFIVHGTPDNPERRQRQQTTAGITNNIRADYANVTAVNGVAEIWLVQDTPQVFYRAPICARPRAPMHAPTGIDDRLPQWLKASAGGAFELYHSARGQIVATLDAGGEAAPTRTIDLEVFTGSVPADSPRASVHRARRRAAGLAARRPSGTGAGADRLAARAGAGGRCRARAERHHCSSLAALDAMFASDGARAQSRRARRGQLRRSSSCRRRPRSACCCAWLNAATARRARCRRCASSATRSPERARIARRWAVLPLRRRGIQARHGPRVRNPHYRSGKFSGSA